MLALALLELTIRQMIAEVPHDLGALIAYSLLAAFVAFIVYGSRSRGVEDARSGPDDSPPGRDG